MNAHMRAVGQSVVYLPMSPVYATCETSFDQKRIVSHDSESLEVFSIDCENERLPVAG